MNNNIERLTHGDRHITLIGTAHISQASSEEVAALIEAEKPERICLELDEGRKRKLMQEDDWSQLNIFQVLRKRKGFMLFASLILSAFQRKLSQIMGKEIAPGNEFIVAINAAKEHNIPVSLCDRDIQVTLSRAWRKSGFIGRNKLIAMIISMMFSKPDISEKEIEQLKDQDILTTMMKEMSEVLPTVKEVLIDERDRYLATKVFQQKEKHVLVVVGKGHIAGIIRILGELEQGKMKAELDAISTVPKPSVIWRRIVPIGVPLAIIGLIVYGFFQSGLNWALEALLRWVIINGTFSAIGTIIAFGHPFTILTAIVLSPITSLTPVIGVGMFTGMMQALIRPPLTGDFENISVQITSIRGFYKNRLTHILLIFVFSTLGSALGTFIALPWLFSGGAA